MTTFSAVDTTPGSVVATRRFPTTRRQDLVGSRLGERHRPGWTTVHGLAVEVEEGDVQPAVGEGQAERQPHVPAAPDDDHVPLESHTPALLRLQS